MLVQSQNGHLVGLNGGHRLHRFDLKSDSSAGIYWGPDSGPILGDPRIYFQCVWLCSIIQLCGPLGTHWQVKEDAALMQAVSSQGLGLAAFVEDP